MTASSLSVVDLITRKRDGHALSEDEIRAFMTAAAVGEVPDYQIAALCMAILLRGMSAEETAAMTVATAESGEMFELREEFPTALEQASTGCVGDYGDLALLPLVASVGVPVAKVSGPPLGYINSIIGKVMATGAEVYLSREQMVEGLRERNIAVACHSDNYAPADRALYAIRAVTGTIPSVPLIASGIMGKKIATGAARIHVDVKYGEGAFIRDEAQANELAETMARVGAALGRRMTVPLIRMHDVLGDVVGPALEMNQAVALLRGEGPADLRGHVLDLAVQLLALAEIESDETAARATLDEAIASGAGVEKLREWIGGQGGRTDFVDDPAAFGEPACTRTVAAPQGGWVSGITAEEVGMAAVRLGAGREQKDAPIDYLAGVVLHRKVGDRVEAGEELFTVRSSRDARIGEAADRVLAAYAFSGDEVARPSLAPERLIELEPAA